MTESQSPGEEGNFSGPMDKQKNEEGAESCDCLCHGRSAPDSFVALELVPELLLGRRLGH